MEGAYKNTPHCRHMKQTHMATGAFTTEVRVHDMFPISIYNDRLAA